MNIGGQSRSPSSKKRSSSIRNHSTDADGHNQDMNISILVRSIWVGKSCKMDDQNDVVLRTM